MESNLNKKEEINEEPYWSLVFGVTLDLIWRNRNELKFSQKNFTTQESICKIKHHVEELVNCMRQNSTLHPQFQLDSIVSSDNWYPPSPGRWKLNCDGSVHNNGRNAGCCGILRDWQGRFIFDFACRLHSYTNVEAELHVILIGMKVV